MERTVVEYVLYCLKQVGVTDVFGVPGDFAFPLNDAICNDKDMRRIGCCNELNPTPYVNIGSSLRVRSRMSSLR